MRYERRAHRTTVAAPASGATCGACGQQVEGKRTQHCTGSSVAYGSRDKPIPHHGFVLYGRCWHCKQALGCDQCAGNVSDVLCTKCAAWGTPQALAEHGELPHLDGSLLARRGAQAPPLSAYPLDFQAAYRKARQQDPTGMSPEAARVFVRQFIKTGSV